MGWDFETEPEFQKKLDWMEGFVREEIFPLETLAEHWRSDEGRAQFKRITDPMKEEVKRQGLWAAHLPPEMGGLGFGQVKLGLMHEILGQTPYGPSIFGNNAPDSGNAELLAVGGTEQQKKEWMEPLLAGKYRSCFSMTEPGAGSDASALKTRARREGNGWVLNGSKLYISNADRAQYGIVFARTDASKGRAGITCFIVDSDTPGFHVRRVVHTLRSSHYATELEFKDCWVSDHQVLGEVNKGFAVANDRLTRQRIPYAAGCIGVAIAAHEMAIEWAKMRTTFGEKLANRQAVQWMLVDNEIDIRTAKYFPLEAAEKARRGLPFRMEAGIAKLTASEGGGRVVDRAMQIHGGMGMTKDLPLERWYREMRIRRVGEGPSEVQRMVIAREILGSSLR